MPFLGEERGRAGATAVARTAAAAFIGTDDAIVRK